MTGWNENNADMSLVNRRRPFDTDLMASHITHETTTTSATSRAMLQPAARRVEDCRLASTGCVQCELERAGARPAVPVAGPQEPQTLLGRLGSVLRRIKHHGGSTGSLSRQTLEGLDPVIRDARG